MYIRKFWRNYLPSIQFYNPHLCIQVFRSHDEVNPILKVHRKSGDILIDMKYQHASDICQRLIEQTSAVVVDMKEEKKINQE